MAFWGCILKPGAKAKIENPEGDILHLSQACLHNPQDGKNYIQAEVQGKTYAIACLERNKKEHDSFDLFFNPDSCAFSNNGKSEVHLTGYFEPDEDMDDESGEEEVPAVANTKTASPKASPKTLPAAVASKTASPKAVAAQSPKKAPVPTPESDDDDSDDIDLECEEEEELENEEEEEEESDEPAPPPPAKRKAEPPSSPAKKAKVSAEAPKAAASPKVGASGGDQAEYLKKILAYLKQSGKTNIGVLGSKVPRPKDCPKMKAFFEQHKDKLKVEGEMVSAK
jgi:nucleophosmin 1